MSTRSCIAYPDTKKKWIGTFIHWDGYPTGVGKEIWNVLHEKFLDNEGEVGVKNNLNPVNAIRAFVDIYIKGHKGGWSSFDKECYCHSPAFVMRDGISNSKIDGENNDPLYIEFVYIIDSDKKTMTILTMSNKDKEFNKSRELSPTKGQIKVGENEWGSIYDYGHCIYGHDLLAVVDLLGDEPKWDELEKEAEE